MPRVVMSRERALRLKGRCPHDSVTWELCSDGTYCPACVEGICTYCRKLWKPVGKASSNGDVTYARSCKCQKLNW